MTTVRYIYMISFDRSETNSVCDNQNTWDDTISCSILVPTDVPPPHLLLIVLHCIFLPFTLL